VIVFLDRLNLQTGDWLRLQLEEGTMWREDITWEMGGVWQDRCAAVHRVDRHSRVVAPIPKDQLNGIVGRRQSEVAGQLRTPTNHRSYLGEHCNRQPLITAQWLERPTSLSAHLLV